MIHVMHVQWYRDTCCKLAYSEGINPLLKVLSQIELSSSASVSRSSHRVDRIHRQPQRAIIQG